MLLVLIFDWGKHIRKIRKKTEFIWVWGCFLGCCVGFFIVHWYAFSCIHRPGWFWAFRGLVSILVLSVKASVGFSLGNNTGKSNKLWKKEKIITWPQKNPCSWFGVSEKVAGDLSPIACFYLPGDGKGRRETCDNWIREGLHVTYDAKAWEQHCVQLLRLQQDLLVIRVKDSLAVSKLFCIPSFYFSVLSFLEDCIGLKRDVLGSLWPTWERADEAMHAEKIGAKQWFWEAL